MGACNSYLKPLDVNSSRSNVHKTTLGACHMASSGVVSRSVKNVNLTANACDCGQLFVHKRQTSKSHFVRAY